MKKKLSLNQLYVSSFVTKTAIVGGAKETKGNCPDDTALCSGAATSSPCICITCDLACEFTYDEECVVG
ncbi:hypothetical protein AB9P05_03020 [Roseivirga sp. BDSF3-8]|uniref:hypothetical protein n=1 Tax=Roseivirga sp. BDSF3-8 TaxID=3241598 RepID=UPI0035325216